MFPDRKIRQQNVGLLGATSDPPVVRFALRQLILPDYRYSPNSNPAPNLPTPAVKSRLKYRQMSALSSSESAYSFSVIFLSRMELSGTIALLRKSRQYFLDGTIRMAPDWASYGASQFTLSIDASLAMALLVLSGTEADDGWGLFAWPLLTECRHLLPQVIQLLYSARHTRCPVSRTRREQPL